MVYKQFQWKNISSGECENMVCKLELVSKELNHFGVIADLFRPVTVVDLCYFALFEDFSL